MPRGIHLDAQTVLDKMRAVHCDMAENHKSISQARRDAGITSSNWSRWNRRFGHLLDSQSAAAKSPAQPTRKGKAKRPMGRGTRRGRSRHNGDGAREPLPLSRAADRQCGQQERENERLRRVIADQAILIHELQHEVRN